MRLITLALILSLYSCGKMHCKGIYTTTDDSGKLHRYDEYYQADQDRCVTNPLELTNFQKTLQARQDNGVKCVPQATAKTLISSGNFYDYRDGKVLLDLGSDGQYRRIMYGEDLNGAKIFSRQLGCYYTRDNQLFLEFEHSASTELIFPAEIFAVADSGLNTNMVRWDNSGDWSYLFCPYLSTPWNFCTALRNGNIMYDPVVSAADQADLFKQALLIRKIYDYKALDKSSFEAAWSTVESYGSESGVKNFKYDVVPLMDQPPYTIQAQIDYVKGIRPTPPDLTSSNIPPICYLASKDVTLADGTSGKIHGEVCYVNGSYVFTQK